MKKMGAILLACLLILTGCAFSTPPEQAAPAYRQIDQASAREMLAQDDGHILLDVRRLDEFESGHIPGAICIPNESIGETQPEELPNLDQILLIYCRSGNRSKQAAEKLARLGYTQVYEFGGILDWTGPVAEGQVLLLTVNANPTTGFSWQAEQEPELFELVEFYTAQPQAEPISGAGGWQSFILTPKGPGTLQLSLRYSRPWEPGDNDPQLLYSLAIAEDLSITVSEEEGGAAAPDYAPVIRIY